MQRPHLRIKKDGFRRTSNKAPLSLNPPPIPTQHHKQCRPLSHATKAALRLFFLFSSFFLTVKKTVQNEKILILDSFY